MLQNISLSLALFCLSFYLSWQFNSAGNFLYSLWYEVLEIDHTIERYGPDNKYKSGFELLTKDEHINSFHGIVSAIQMRGRGLDTLTYNNKTTQHEEKLLTDAEILHLQDVANLVTKLKYFGLLALLAAFFLVSLMRINKIPFAKIKSHLLGGLGFLVLLIICVFLIGPTKVFYLGHELIFPNNHQWFFYYEESLMSTMMKAPILFGPIACQLLALTIAIWVCLQFFARYFLTVRNN